MADETAPAAKKPSVATVVTEPVVPNWVGVHGVKTCPDCGEGKRTRFVNGQRVPFCPARKEGCQFSK